MSGPRRGDHVDAAYVDGELVLLDRAAAKLHLLNPSAAAIWEALDGERPVGDVVELAARAFATTAEAITDDVEDALAHLRAQGVLAGDQAAPTRPNPSVRALHNEAARFGLSLPDEALLLHGGAVATPDGTRAVAVVGVSGAGKSTATAKLVVDGWPYVSDEVVVVGEQLRVAAHHRPIEVTHETLYLLGAAVTGAATKGARKWSLPAASLRGGLHHDAVPLALVVVPMRAPDAEVEVLEPREALEVLAQASFNVAALDGGLELLVRIAKSVPVASVPTNSLDDLGAHIQRLL